MRLPALVAPGPELSAQEKARYQRHFGLAEVGQEGQRRLRAARVLVVGAGGLGAPALQYLAAAGVGTIGVIDDDRVEASNLQRQVIHGVDDVGRAKVSSAAEAVRRINPFVEVVEHQVRLDPSNALELVRGYDLVLDGTDNFATRYLVSDACEVAGRPVVWGAILRFSGQVAVFWGEHGPTYRDLFPQPPAPGSVPSCSDAGVLGVLPGVVGSLMTTEALKLILGVGDLLLGRLLVYDGLAASVRTLTIARDLSREPVTTVELPAVYCAAPSTEGQVDVEAAARLLARRDAGELELSVIDVREPWETELGMLPGAVNVPVALIEATGLAALPEAARGRELLVYCQSGVRSQRALARLVADRSHAEVATRQLAGGYQAWSRQVAP